MLVAEPDRVAVADAAVAELDIKRISVVDHAEVDPGARRQRPHHDRADDRNDRRVDDRAGTHQPPDLGFAFLPAMDVDVGVVADQAARPADPVHDAVAGVDAQPALDAFELQPVPDVDAGRADRDALEAVDAVAGRFVGGAGALGLLDRHARLAAVVAVGDVERPFVGERGLDARPRAHVGADLLAGEAGEQIGRAGQDADPHVGHRRGLERGEVAHQGRRVGEVEHPGAAGPPGDQQPEGVLGDLLGHQRRRPAALVGLHPLATVAFDQTLHRIEQVGPDGLRTQVAAPDPAGQRIHQEQHHRGEDQQAGEVVDLLRPDLDEEEVEAAAREIDQNRLVGRVRSTVPAHEGQQVVDAEREGHDGPLDRPEPALDLLRIDLLATCVEAARRPAAATCRRIGAHSLKTPARPEATIGSD